MQHRLGHAEELEEHEEDDAHAELRPALLGVDLVERHDAPYRQQAFFPGILMDADADVGQRVRHVHDCVLALDAVDEGHLRRPHAEPRLFDRHDCKPAAGEASRSSANSDANTWRACRAHRTPPPHATTHSHEGAQESSSAQIGFQDVQAAARGRANGSSGLLVNILVAGIEVVEREVVSARDNAELVRLPVVVIDDEAVGVAEACACRGEDGEK